MALDPELTALLSALVDAQADYHAARAAAFKLRDAAEKADQERALTETRHKGAQDALAAYIVAHADEIISKRGVR